MAGICCDKVLSEIRIIDSDQIVDPYVLSSLRIRMGHRSEIRGQKGGVLGTRRRRGFSPDAAARLSVCVSVC